MSRCSQATMGPITLSRHDMDAGGVTRSFLGAHSPVSAQGVGDTARLPVGDQMAEESMRHQVNKTAQTICNNETERYVRLGHKLPECQLHGMNCELPRAAQRQGEKAQGLDPGSRCSRVRGCANLSKNTEEELPEGSGKGRWNGVWKGEQEFAGRERKGVTGTGNRRS